MNINNDNIHALHSDERIIPNRPASKIQSHSLPVHMFLTVIWSLSYFTFYLLQQISEILAPIMLVLGVIWSIAPHLVSSVTKAMSNTDPQTRDLASHFSNIIPESLTIGSHTITAGGLIFDGILLIVLTALAATITALLGRRV